MTLPPGPYTAHLTGKDNGTGVGLVEVFEAAAAIDPTPTLTPTPTPSPSPTPLPITLPQSVSFNDRNNVSETWSSRQSLTLGESPNNTNRVVSTIDINRGGVISRIQPLESNFSLLTGNNRSLTVAAMVHSDTLDKVVEGIVIGRDNALASADLLIADSITPTNQQVGGVGMDKTSQTFENPFKSFFKRIFNGKETLTIVYANNRIDDCDLTVATVPCVQAPASNSLRLSTAIPTIR